MLSLAALLTPAVAMLVFLCAAPAQWALPSLVAPRSWPWEFWCMAVAGATATVAGVLDWRFHRNGGRRLVPAERRTELFGMACGVPLFALLAVASVVDEPRRCLLPIVICAMGMAGLVAVDEARFHRACGRYETVLHRVLVGGNAVAFLAWLSWGMSRAVAHG